MTGLDPDSDPARSHLQSWLPHLLLMTLVACSLLLLLLLLRPLRDPLLLAVSLATLTAPLLFEPWERLLHRSFPKMGSVLRQQMAGIAATCCLVVILVTPFIALILDTVGSIEQATQVFMGMINREPQQMEALFSGIERQFHTLLRLYPGLPFDAAQLRSWLDALFSEASTFGPHFLGFLFRGTSSFVVQLILSLLILPNCYAQGARAARFILHYTPLNTQQMDALAARHRSIVLRMLSDTLAFALCRGLSLGLLAWLFTGLGLPLLPLVLVATFLSLVPAIGTTMFWLPLVLMQWGAGMGVAAALLGLLSLFSSLFLSWLRRRVGQRLDESSDSWLSFLLFLGIVGGILGFGAQGFVIGPMIIVLSILVFGHLLPYYGVGEDQGDYGKASSFQDDPP